MWCYRYKAAQHAVDTGNKLQGAFPVDFLAPSLYACSCESVFGHWLVVRYENSTEWARPSRIWKRATAERLCTDVAAPVQQITIEVFSRLHHTFFAVVSVLLLSAVLLFPLEPSTRMRTRCNTSITSNCMLVLFMCAACMRCCFALRAVSAASLSRGEAVVCHLHLPTLLLNMQVRY